MVQKELVNLYFLMYLMMYLSPGSEKRECQRKEAIDSHNRQ